MLGASNQSSVNKAYSKCLDLRGVLNRSTPMGKRPSSSSFTPSPLSTITNVCISRPFDAFPILPESQPWSKHKRVVKPRGEVVGSSRSQQSVLIDTVIQESWNIDSGIRDDHADPIENQAIRNLEMEFEECDTSRTRERKARQRWRIPKDVEYWDFGDAIHGCKNCGAFFWFEERTQSGSTRTNPKYSLCCNNRKVQLARVQPAPSPLAEMIFGTDVESKHFQTNIRSYNCMFSFTSLGGRIQRDNAPGRGPPNFKLGGQNYHQIGSLLPKTGVVPKFAQLYIYDTQNEDMNRIRAVRKEEHVDSLHVEVVAKLRQMLDQHNVLVKSFRMIGQRIESGDEHQVQLRLIGKRTSDPRNYNLPSVAEVAALVVGDLDQALGERDIVVQTQAGPLRRINELNPAYLSLQYPLLFPFGDDGYREDIPFFNASNSNVGGRRSVSVREFLSYRIHERLHETPFILHSRRLFQELCVDGYTMMESSRLTYISTHQKKLRCEMYNKFSDSLVNGDTDASFKGKRIVVPASFVGGARYMIQNYQDAMAICRWIGYPDLFLTFTCNPRWPEIYRFLKIRNLNPEDRPDITSRVFNVKLKGLIKQLKTKRTFGVVRAVVYTVEFQKRGLPHAHILLFLAQENKFPTPGDIDRIICAELPDEMLDPVYFKAVTDFMLHGPCGNGARNAPCMIDGKCSKHFPKQFNEETNVDDDGYPRYRRRNDGRHVMKNGVVLDNRFVVPHNRDLLIKYGAHLNVEWCNQSRSIKYLFKYINKGHDRVTAGFYESAKVGSSSTTDQPNEVQLYYDCRYISPCEATWRIFGYPIQFKFPSVERLSFHLPGEQWIFWDDEDDATEVYRRESIRESKFLAWMKANATYPEAKLLTYAEFPQKFVWKSEQREYFPRKLGFAIGRMIFVPPGSGEAYYLRMLLNVIRGPTSYADLKTMNDVVHDTYRDACYALGLLDDDKEYIDAFTEASQWSSALQLRILFVTLLTNVTMSRPKHVWDKCWECMADDILHRQRILLGHQDEVKNYALIEIEMLLRARGKSLRDYEEMPFPDMDVASLSRNRLILDELQYDRTTLATEHIEMMRSLNCEQHMAYEAIMRLVEMGVGGVFFVYGYGGTGKTFVWKTLSAALRSKGEIVLNVASSGIASLLLPGGRTAHSRFGIPLTPHENSTCNIKHGTPQAELLLRTKLIIWDEAPMTHKYCFEALDRTLRDIMSLRDQRNAQLPFGGKTIVFGGDFRQILPVIPKGTRQNIVNATINSSYIWQFCTVLRLTVNMRLQHMADDSAYGSSLEFANWIASIGDGLAGEENDGCCDVDIPHDMVLQSPEDPVAAIVQATYPDFESIARDPNYLQERAILAPTLEVVDAINDYMTSMNLIGEAMTYLSSDSVCKSDSNVDAISDLHSPEFLNNIKASGVPNHELRLKVGTPIMLLRNIDQAMGLCNGTRLIVTRLGNHLIQGKVMGGKNAGHEVVIPRLTLTPSDTRIPFKFQRKQFPIMTSYAMTINKSQGQSLKHVGLLLKKPVFSHGQLYVALSRVTNRRGLKVLICNDDLPPSNTTRNVVYKEVFQNI